MHRALIKPYVSKVVGSSKFYQLECRGKLWKFEVLKSVPVEAAKRIN